MIAVSTKYRAKQKHLLTFHFTNNRLKETIYSKYKSKTSNKVKDIDIKNQTYYFFNDIINIKFFVPNNVKIDENSCESILICYIGYVTIKDLKYMKINSVNPLHLIFSKVNGYFEEINKNKYLKLVPTNESKEKIKTYEELWSKNRELISSITKNSNNYHEKYMKIKFTSNEELPLNKMQ